MKGKRYILLWALCAITLWLPARQYEQGEKIYVNADQSNRDGEGKFNWSVDNANLLLYVWKTGMSNSQQWVDLNRENGNLVITCDGKSTTIANAKSPQIFSITGLRATTTANQTTTATATFTGNNGCTKTATVHIPNATQCITRTHIDVLVGETAALNTNAINTGNEMSLDRRVEIIVVVQKNQKIAKE